MLSLFSVEKYFSLSMSMLVWLLAYVGLCFSANVVADSKCLCISIIIYLRVAGVRQNVSFMYIYPFYIPLINIFLPEYIRIQFLSDTVWCFQNKKKEQFHTAA